jgi:hypothetical protein
MVSICTPTNNVAFSVLTQPLMSPKICSYNAMYACSVIFGAPSERAIYLETAVNWRPLCYYSTEGRRGSVEIQTKNKRQE